MGIAKIAGRIVRVEKRETPAGDVWQITLEIPVPDASTSDRDRKRDERQRRG